MHFKVILYSYEWKVNNISIDNCIEIFMLSKYDIGFGHRY